MTLKIDPEYEALVPKPSDIDRTNLKASIKKDKLWTPIIVNAENVILDGHTRYAICNELEIDADDTLIVGDTELDILCGKNAGAITCGVTYGYRTRESLKENNPDYLVDDFSEIKSLMNE